MKLNCVGRLDDEYKAESMTPKSLRCPAMTRKREQLQTRKRSKRTETRLG
jgi:hypothetical protein